MRILRLPSTSFLLAVAACLASCAAWAMPTIAVSPSDLGLKKRVNETTQVRHGSFAINVPTHWNFIAGKKPAQAGDGAWILITPADDIKNAPVRLSLRSIGQAPGSMDQLRAQWAADEKRHIRYVFWQSHRWLLSETVRGSVHEWSAYSTERGSGFWMTAAAPEASADQVRPTLFQAMESMRLLPR